MKNTSSYLTSVKAIKLVAEEAVIRVKVRLKAEVVKLKAEARVIPEAKVQVMVLAEMVSLLLVKLLHTQEELTIMIVMELLLLVIEDLVRRLKLLRLKKMEDLIQSM